jgi:hypothetical protein
MPWPKGKTRVLSTEHKDKIRQSHLGKTHSLLSRVRISIRKKGQQPWITGRVHTLATREKLRISHIGKPGYWAGKKRSDMTGDKHWSWKGGITSENHRLRNSVKFRQWRNAVFRRDNWTCQRCGQHGGKLHPHHLIPFASKYGRTLRFVISNGWTVCKRCHRYLHSPERV